MENDGIYLSVFLQAWIAEVGPFQFPIAPDHIHKAHVSGGMPYAIDTSRPSIDTLVLNSRDCTGVFHHVSNAFSWGGFPGFDYIDAALPDEVVALRNSLLRI